MDACRRTLDYLLGLPGSEPFRAPFDWEGRGLDDYLSVVQAPMDLGTVKDNLDEGMYHSAEDFVADTRLVFENAIAYFPEGDPMRNAAESLLQAFEDRIQRETQQSDAMLARDPGYSSSGVPPASAQHERVARQEREREATAQHGQRLETAMRLIAEAASPQQHQQQQQQVSAGQRWGAITASPAGADADPAVHEVTAALLASQRHSQSLQEENQQLRAMLHFGASHESARRRRRLELAQEALPEGELQRLLAGLASGEDSLAYGTRAADERRIAALAHGDLRSAVGEVVDRVSAELRSQSQEHFDAERSDLALLSKDEMRLELERTRDGLLRLVQTYEESLRALVERVDVVTGASQDTEAILTENAELRAALDSARAEAMRLTNEAEEASHAKRERDEMEQMHLSTNQALQRQVHRLTEENAQLQQQLQDLAKWRQRAQTEREEADYIQQDREAQAEESARLREQVAQLAAAKHGAEQDRDQLARRVQLLEKQLVMAEQTQASVGL